VRAAAAVHALRGGPRRRRSRAVPGTRAESRRRTPNCVPDRHKGVLLPRVRGLAGCADPAAGDGDPGRARETPEPAPTILDLGTGSGCIAISLAKHLPHARLAASDNSEAALAVARRNAERHGVAERIEFRCGDLFAPWDDGPLFDVVVCNPPYVATAGAPVDASVRDFEPHAALFAGPDGLDVIRRVVREGPRRLRAGGHLLVEMAYDQAAAVRKLMEQATWQEVVAYRDAAGHERVLHARRRVAEQAQVA
jgi:release factor glutamine methyltransferase